MLEANNWTDRINNPVKDEINLIDFKRELNRLFLKYRNSMPINYAIRKTTKEMTSRLKEKGLKNSDIVHLIHVCEVFPYSGYGCCKHRENPF